MIPIARRDSAQGTGGLPAKRKTLRIGETNTSKNGLPRITLVPADGRVLTFYDRSRIDARKIIAGILLRWLHGSRRSNRHSTGAKFEGAGALLKE
jgi:hypothetical protein